jgi:hypothetical protein
LKRFVSFRLEWAFIIFLSLINIPVCVLAQQQDPSEASARPGPRSPVNGQDRTQIFTGKIVSSKGRLVFIELATQAVYPLENQEKAKQYAGKNVKVRGLLDPATNMILITDVESLPPHP